MWERNEVIGPAQLTLDEIEGKSLGFKSKSFYTLFFNLTEGDFVLEEWKKKVSDDREVIKLRFVVDEMIKNACFWGNEFVPWKKFTIGCGWVDDIFYCVVKDQGKGFDINNPAYHAESEGGGIIGSRRRVDALYNFGDNASYFCVRKP